MGNQAFKERLEHAEKTGICQLKGCRLKTLPARLLEHAAVLRSLDLSSNRLAELPSFIGHFENLKQLTLDRNRLTALPDELGNLVRLEQLSAEGNRLSELPATMGRLKKLKQLNLSANCFRHFPMVLCQIGQIDLIDLSANEIQEVPDGVERLNVVELNLNQNRLTSICRSLAQCQRLKVLRLQENCLPLESFWSPLLAESQVSVLAVEGNLFDMKDFRHVEGYDRYMERFTATKKKLY